MRQSRKGRRGNGEIKTKPSTVSVRLTVSTRQRLTQIAADYDCYYGDQPWVGGLLARIGKGELIIVPAPPGTLIQAHPNEKEASTPIPIRMTRKNRKVLESIAVQYSCLYNQKPAIAALLERVGRGELIIVPAPPPPPKAEATIC